MLTGELQGVLLLSKFAILCAPWQGTMCSKLIDDWFWAFWAFTVKVCFQGDSDWLINYIWFLQNNFMCYLFSILDAKHKVAKLRWGNIWSRCWNCQSIGHAWRSISKFNTQVFEVAHCIFEGVKEYNLKLFCKMFQEVVSSSVWHSFLVTSFPSQVLAWMNMMMSQSLFLM